MESIVKVNFAEVISEQINSYYPYMNSFLTVTISQNNLKYGLDVD